MTREQEEEEAYMAEELAAQEAASDLGYYNSSSQGH